MSCFFNATLKDIKHHPLASFLEYFIHETQSKKTSAVTGGEGQNFE